MPWLDDSLPSSASAQKWKTVFKNSLLRRITADQLTGAFRELASQYRASPDEIAKVLLSFRAQVVGTDDPLIFSYARALLRLKLVATNHLLLALLGTSRFARHSGSDGSDKPNGGLPTCEERMFNMLTQMHMSGDLSYRVTEAHELVYALTRWMQAISEYETAKQLEGGALHSVDTFSFGMYEAVASLAITILGQQAFREVAKQPWWKKRRATVVSEMENFDTHVLQWMQSPLGGRLRALATMPPFLETDSKGRPIFTDQQILQAIPDLQTVHSKAGLFVWLNACLCARPLTDDLNMLTYLQNRYSGNNQSLSVDLLVASFDVLTNALLRRESEQSLHVIRSFICNKLPHLLGIVSGFMGPAMTVEACIQMAFISITMDALPPISAGSNEVREKLKLTRLEFLQAAALHGLISESTISTILEEPPTSMPKASKHTKENLLAQCSNNVGRLEPLIDELDAMVGNAGAIAGCVVDTINNLCVNKDTISLKSVCHMLIKKIPSLDVILQYTQPANLFLPLCTLLNDWTHDQDQTEFTPAYEEFAAILLFVLAAVHRYGLTRSDLGLANDDNFIARLLQEITISKSANELPEDQGKQLAKWIEGLYATDESGETGGISDEVMRQCPPQAFYQLVPTLFEQSVLACKAGTLTMKTLKGGLELLVEPFLLPSLVGGLIWLIKRSWEDHGDADVLLTMLDKLLRPSSSAQETKAMHKAILAIVADPLHQSLLILNQRQPNKKQVPSLMNILKPHTELRRTMETPKAELEDWASTENGGISRRIRNEIGDLVAWVSSVGPTPPPKYTHRLFYQCCEKLGVNGVRDVIVAELKEQTNLGSGLIAMDICNAMVSAPLPSSQVQTSPPTVRDALRLATSDVQKLLHISATDAESLVRLSRRVEQQLAVTQIPQLPMAMPIQDQATDQVMAELGLTDDALGTNAADTSGVTSGNDFNNADLSAVLDQAMDLTNPSAQNNQNVFDDLDMDLGQSSHQQLMNPDGSGNLDGEGQNTEEDIFAGLDMNLGDDFNFS